MQELRLVAGANCHIAYGANMLPVTSHVSTNVLVPQADLELPPHPIHCDSYMGSGLGNLLVHVGKGNLRVLLPFVEMLLGHHCPIDEVTGRAVPCLVDNSGDGQGTNPFQHTVVDLGHVGCHDAVPSTKGVVKKGSFLIVGGMHAHPLRELTLRCAWPRTSTRTLGFDLKLPLHGIELALLVLQAELLELLHEVLAPEAYVEVGG